MQRRGRSRPGGVLSAALVVLVVAGPPSYDAAAMSEGVEREVPGNEPVVTRAVAFHPAEVPEFEVRPSTTPRWASDEAVVLRAGLRDHDVTVAYRTGPSCGLLPAVEVRPSEPPTVMVAPGNGSVAAADRDCESLEFVEPVGLELAPDVDPDGLRIEVVGR